MLFDPDQFPTARLPKRSHSPAYKILVGLVSVLVVPFVIILAMALFGVQTSQMPGFNSWLMGILTIAGALALLAAISACVRNRHFDWFWLFLAASATIFWGSIFLESINR